MSASKANGFSGTTSASAVRNPFDSLINELESSLKSLLSIYNVDLIENKTNHELMKKSVNLNEQTKTNIETNVNDLYEKAHKLETLFLQHRLELSKSSPQLLLQEEIECLKAELKRKEDLLADTKEKLNMCEGALVSSSALLDAQLKNRLEMSTHGYLPTDGTSANATAAAPSAASFSNGS